MNLENDKGDIAFAQFYVTYYSNGEWPYLEFSAEFRNGGFELIFPATIPDEFFEYASIGLLTVHTDVHNSDNANIGGFSFRSVIGQLNLSMRTEMLLIKMSVQNAYRYLRN